MILLSRFFPGGLPDKLSPAITFYAGYAGVGMMATGLLITAAQPPAPIALAAAALVGFGFSFPWPLIATTVLKRAHPAECAATLGAVSGFVDAFIGASAFLSGKIANSYRYPAVYVFAAAGVAVSGLLAHGYRKEPAGKAESPVSRPTLYNENG